MFSDRFDQLVQALRILPSVGPKSAQRMALHMIMKNREGAIGLAHALTEATNHIHECSVCHSLTEDEVCNICTSLDRDDELLCVVESPADVMAIEQSGSFRGKYHVLGGHLSPLDGIGPEEIGIPYLLHRLANGQFSLLTTFTARCLFRRGRLLFRLLRNRSHSIQNFTFENPYFNADNAVCSMSFPVL